MRSRSPLLAIAGCLCVALLASACTSNDGATTTVTSATTVAPSTSLAVPAPALSTSSQPADGSTASNSPASSGTATGSSSSGSRPASSSKAATSSKPTATSSKTPTGSSSFDHPQDGVALPDGFVPKKLKPGQKPPQFVIVSFDGVGWHEKWQHWFDVGTKVPFRFTGFLSGTYMLTAATKDHYDAPFYGPGHTEINWNSAADLPVEINDINQALSEGDEVGTHFNGHFCVGAGEPSGGDNWTTANWNQELDQFFMLIKAKNLFPALQAHQMIYDSSFTKYGISWPTKGQNGIWQIGMAEYPMHGTLTGNTDVPAGKRSQHLQITMDYNFYYSQEQPSSDGVSPAQSKIDSQQVWDTYKDMYTDAFNGNRAPLILGNHLNEWNNDAYATALTNFVLGSCGKADTECVPFRDLIAWMKVQDPARLAQLQGEGSMSGQQG